MAPQQKEVDRFWKAWMQMRQVVQAANFNRFQREGLSATQFMMLNTLPAQEQSTLTLGDLARRLNLSAATVTQTVDSLEARGLVQRHRSANDARRVALQVTPLGRELQNAATGEFHRFIAGLLRGMDDKKRTAMVEGLEELASRGLEQTSDPAPVAGASTRRANAAPRAKRNSP